MATLTIVSRGDHPADAPDYKFVAQDRHAYPRREAQQKIEGEDQTKPVGGVTVGRRKQRRSLDLSPPRTAVEMHRYRFAPKSTCVASGLVL